MLKLCSSQSKTLKVVQNINTSDWVSKDHYTGYELLFYFPQTELYLHIFFA